MPTWLLEEPKPFTPYRASQPALPWYNVFLVHYATHGGKSLAAAAAGVTLREVNKHLDRDAIFRGELEEAYSYHCDLIEWESLSLGRRKGNPLSYFDRLKAELPARHLDRALVATVDLKAEIPGELGAELLRGMLAQATPATRAILEGRALEVHAEDVTPDA